MGSILWQEVLKQVEGMLDRFVYYKDSQMVLDRLTGERYHCNSLDLVELLNQLNNRGE